MEFPKWLYHATEEPVIVNDPAEEAALGGGWADTPAAFAGDDKPKKTAKK